MKSSLDPFQLLDDEPKQDTIHSALFPNDPELQKVYDNHLIANEKLKKAIAKGESELQIGLSSSLHRKIEPLNETVTTPNALATVEAKQAELFDDIARLTSDIEQNNSLINESQQLIEGAKTQYTEAIVSGNLEAIDEIEAQIKNWETNIKHLKLRNDAIKQTITKIEEVKKITGRIIGRIKHALFGREIKEAKKVYDKHLKQFAEYFKTYHDTFSKDYDISKHRRGIIIRDIEKAIYEENGYTH